MPVPAIRTSAKARTRRSMAGVSAIGSECGTSRASTGATDAAISTPSAPPTRARRKLSVRSCRTSRCRAAAAVAADGGAGDARDPPPQQYERGEEAGRITAPPSKDGAHLFAVLGTEGGGIEAQEGAIQGDHALPDAKPLARARRTSWVSRRASARATAVPNVVIR